jgi:hypothetical protein
MTGLAAEPTTPATTSLANGMDFAGIISRR